MAAIARRFEVFKNINRHWTWQLVDDRTQQVVARAARQCKLRGSALRAAKREAAHYGSAAVVVVIED